LPIRKQDVVSVEPVDVEGVPERAESGPRQVLEEGGELVDDQDVGEVEEQLEGAD
jgi:hypothetical protein